MLEFLTIAPQLPPYHHNLLWQACLGLCIGAFSIWLLFPKQTKNIAESICEQIATIPIIITDSGDCVDSRNSRDFAREKCDTTQTNSTHAPTQVNSTQIKSTQKDTTWANSALDSTSHNLAHSPFSHTNPLTKARYMSASACGIICGGAGFFVESFMVYVWLCAVVIVLTLLCVWDMLYYVVPDWQNLTLLVLGLTKGFAPLVLAHSHLGLESMGVDSVASFAPLLNPPLFDSPFFAFFDINVLYHALLGAGLIALIYMLGLMLWHRQILGDGDIVFCAGLSAICGFENLLLGIFWGCVCASIVILGTRFYRLFHTHIIPRLCNQRVFSARASLESNTMKSTQAYIPLIPYILVGLLFGVGLEVFLGGGL